MTNRRSSRIINNNDKENNVSTLAASRTATLRRSARLNSNSNNSKFDVVDNETTREINTARSEVTNTRKRTSDSAGLTNHQKNRQSECAVVRSKAIHREAVCLSKKPPFAQSFAIFWCAAEKGNLASLGQAYADVSLSVEMQDERLVSSITNLQQLAKAMNLGVNDFRRKLFAMGVVELYTSEMFGAGLAEHHRSILFNDPSKVMRFVFENESGEPLLFPGMNLNNYLALTHNPLYGTDESSRNETYRNAIMTGRFRISIYNSDTNRTTNLAPIASLNECIPHLGGKKDGYSVQLNKMQVDFYKSPSIRHDPFTWGPITKGKNKGKTYTVKYY